MKCVKQVVNMVLCSHRFTRKLLSYSLTCSESKGSAGRAAAAALPQAVCLCKKGSGPAGASRLYQCWGDCPLTLILIAPRSH